LLFLSNSTPSYPSFVLSICSSDIISSLRDPHSFPTRRSSDLAIRRFAEMNMQERAAAIAENPLYGRIICRCETITEAEIVEAVRSEEHTSELQSRFDLVCRLLLEKKNN